MCVDFFDFDFFEDWIVLCFVILCDVVWMLVVDGGGLYDWGVGDLLLLFCVGDCFVFNDMCVIFV